METHSYLNRCNIIANRELSTQSKRTQFYLLHNAEDPEFLEFLDYKPIVAIIEVGKVFAVVRFKQERYKSTRDINSCTLIKSVKLTSRKGPLLHGYVTKTAVNIREKYQITGKGRQLYIECMHISINSKSQSTTTMLTAH